ncbi:MAG: rubrerythrin family protein [Firmicutes bacterium]|nr:rubrerythrin family protein [Bacillota bacterium]
MNRTPATVPLREETCKKLLVFQRNELTEYHIYSLLAVKAKNEANRKLLKEIAGDELAHHDFYRELTKKDLNPQWWKVFVFYWAARIFGLTFTLKLMEKGEERAQNAYMEIYEELPEVRKIAEEEEEHEHELLNLIAEEHLDYVGSIVLGLNDALVELTGTLAGLTFALQNTRLIALAGLITGIAASFSMGASEYLSTKAEGTGEQEPFKSAVYTWIAYLITVAALILPYLLLTNYLLSLGITLLVGILIILFFNFYISVVKDLPFRRRFLEMTGISLGVAVLSFSIGYIIRLLLGVDL